MAANTNMPTIPSSSEFKAANIRPNEAMKTIQIKKPSQINLSSAPQTNVENIREKIEVKSENIQEEIKDIQTPQKTTENKIKRSIPISQEIQDTKNKKEQKDISEKAMETGSQFSFFIVCLVVAIVKDVAEIIIGFIPYVDLLSPVISLPFTLTL
jgi:phosphoenolpyruvate synthase/pyruvate phosphate dikinase